MKGMAGRFSTILLGLAFAGSSWAADVPFGHADWLPSPADPVGHAGQGANWYPGATPPTEWYEGLRGVGPMKVAGRNSLPTEYPEDSRLGEPIYLDQRSKNILWKVATPGWSDSQPIVIGKRVVHVADRKSVV